MSVKLDMKVDLTRRQPTLFVGLGGAGSKVVNRIAGELKTRDDWDQIQNIYQFFVLDTDKADIDTCRNIEMAHRSIISNFDKGSYVAEKRGRNSISRPIPDPRVTQWVHDWYNFRGSQGAGAGQIRIESRLSIYNFIESSDMIKRMEEAIAKTIHMSNAMVDTRLKKMNVFIYFSAAGGTGSGANLTIAAFLRHIIGQFGWSANIIGVCILPTLFLSRILNPRQRDDILCNGYATLKEIEHLMRIKVTADDPSRRITKEFIYHPFIKTTEIKDSPFDFVYIIDTTSDLSVDEHFRDVVADAMYLQIFSPIFGRRDSDYDNYEKNQKRLANGLFTVHYGSFGCSLLMLPDRKILEYCAMRQTGEVFSRYLSGRFVSTDQQDTFDPEAVAGFHDKDPEEQNAIRDLMFCKFIDNEVDSEERQSDKVKKNFTELKARMGVIPQCTHESLVGIEKNVIDSLSKEKTGKSDSLEVLMDRQELLNPWFQSMMESVYRMEEKGERSTQTAQGGRANPWPARSFFGLRAEWEKRVTEAIETELNKVYFEIAPVSLEKYVRPEGDTANWEADVQAVVKSRAEKAAQRLMHIDQRLEGLLSSYKQKFANLRFLTEFFKSRGNDIYMQRYLTFALSKEISAYKTALTILIRQYSETAMRKEFEGFIGDKRYEKNLQALYEEAKKTFWEMVRRFGNTKGEDQAYTHTWDQSFKKPMEDAQASLESLQRYKFLYEVYSIILKTLEKYLTNLRNFYNISATPIKDIEKRCASMIDEKSEHVDGYIVEEEVLRDLSSRRLWDKYYEQRIKGKGGDIDPGDLMKIITDALSSDVMKTDYDRAVHIENRLIAAYSERLRPIIVGQHSSGNQQRGIDLQQGLELEAELKYVDYLKANGFWDGEDGWGKVYQQYLTLPADIDPIPPKVQTMKEGMRKFSRNYLEVKIQKCLRNCKVLSNINMNDPNVVEFGCKQSMVVFNTDLYHTVESDEDSLKFPEIINRLEPAFIQLSWENAKIAVFYSAVLGVPLFCFGSVPGRCKEAYNRRVTERHWDKPAEGRQYPLHIDKNWEPDDPLVDRSKLPMSLDPEEAKKQETVSSREMVDFFEMFLQLIVSGDLVYDEELSQYQVPSGKLTNKNGPINLGHTPREAIVALLSTVPAHEILKKRCADLKKLTKEEIQKYQKPFTTQNQVDIWHQEKQDAELQFTIDLFKGLLRVYDEKEKEEELKSARARIGQSIAD